VEVKQNYNQDWSEYFQLDCNSPSGLSRIKNYRGKNIEKYDIGYRKFQKNGTPNGWRLCFKQKSYYVHRIIWVLTYGTIDNTMVVDHLDGNPFNNRIENLSLKSQKENTRNKCQRADNTTGSTGIHLIALKNGNFSYVVQWSELNGKRGVKKFRTSEFGDIAAKQLAISFREQQIRRLILEGADYTERHGTEPKQDTV